MSAAEQQPEEGKALTRTAELRAVALGKGEASEDQQAAAAASLLRVLWKVAKLLWPRTPGGAAFAVVAAMMAKPYIEASLPRALAIYAAPERDQAHEERFLALESELAAIKKDVAEVLELLKERGGD